MIETKVIGIVLGVALIASALYTYFRPIKNRTAAVVWGIVELVLIGVLAFCF